MAGASGVQRLIVWSGVDGWRAEAASVELEDGGLRASGTQIGEDPEPYRLDYELDATGEGSAPRAHRHRGGRGLGPAAGARARRWGRVVVRDRAVGALHAARAGGDPGAVHGALDCDLGRCPLTNTMPVLRHGLHRRPGAVDFLMAWVSVPDLGLHLSRQRYEHVRAQDEGSIVRYVGEHRSFVGELRLDRDAIVTEYPELARRAG